MEREKLGELLETEWIIQSCEASQWLFYPPLVASFGTLKERYGAAYDLILTYVEDGYGYSIYSAESAEKVARHVVAEEEEKPGRMKEVVAEWRKDEGKFLEACRKVDGMDTRQVSDEELAAAFNEFHDAYLMGWGYSLLTDGFGMLAEKLVTEKLLPVLERRGEEKKFSRYLPVLTAPVTRSWATDETIDFLDIVQQARESPEISGALSLPAGERIGALKEHQEFWKKVSEHSKKYFWIRNSYLRARFLDAEYFADAVLEAVKENVDVPAEIRRLEESPKKAAEEKSKLVAELELDESLIRILRLVEEFAALIDAKKKMNFIGDHYMMLFLGELCRRRGYKKEDWLALTPPEYGDALAGKIDVKAMAERTKASLFIGTQEGIEIVAGDEARRFFKELQRETRGEVVDVRGTSASPGRAEGMARIIMATKDLPKMRQGDVLVSGMTRPELVPAMKKACAIVTDEGGITSHAAIVSRELGIPCVIGTKIATKVFKDGDFVEVNANHGVVRKIQEK